MDVIKLTDPRKKSDRYQNETVIRNNSKQSEFESTQFIIDEFYVGNPPRVQVSIENLNDNIDENFLRRDLEKLGRIRTLDIVRHPETRQHLGLARVQFEDPKVATCCVETFNGKQVMGKQLCVYHDVRFACIERRKEEKMRPQPVLNHIELPRITVPATPILPVFAPIPFPPVITPSQVDALPRPINRQHASLDERLAKLGLKQSAGPFPTIPPPPPHATTEKIPPLTPYLPNHASKSSQEKRPIVHPPERTREEEERLWNPVRSPEPSPPPSPVEEIVLTLVQITDTVVPVLHNKFIEEIKKNLNSTLLKRLVHTYGYPYIDEAQKKYREEKDMERFEEAKRDAMRKQILNERKYFNREKVDLKPELQARPRANMIRQRVPTQHQMQEERNTDNDLRRKNRSAALAPELGRSQHSSEDSHSDDSYRESRSLHRKRRHSGSRSNSHSSRESSSSLSSTSSSSSSRSGSSSSSISSNTSHHSSSSSQYSEPRGVFKMETSTDIGPIQSTLMSAQELKAKEELDAARALASMIDQPITQSIKVEADETEDIKLATKKRRKKDVDQEIHGSKRIKTEIHEEKTSPKKEGGQPKLLVFPPRDRNLIEKMNTDLYSIDDEDLKYLESVHKACEDAKAEDTRIPFGTMEANKAHLLSFEAMKKELDSKNHPKWWNGCSRCSVIKTSDRGKVEELKTTYQDLTVAPIKSHVIQAAVSTRRDQRSDQRRMAALNPEIDPTLLKQLTLNTLQMRAKNLRFSRSKIHQWGLFACEKIASGDAVIEYVGEKIRHSVADHRELQVYPNLTNHDGSSYFFRVDTDVIDASFKGNKARFINHSCNPNCIAKIIKHDNGTNSIVIYAKQTIHEDEEITYDYKFPREDENKIRCNCRAPKCHVWLN